MLERRAPSARGGEFTVTGRGQRSLSGGLSGGDGSVDSRLRGNDDRERE